MLPGRFTEMPISKEKLEVICTFYNRSLKNLNPVLEYLFLI
jgi:hypothetical protein